MSKPSYRVYLVVHHGVSGPKVSGTLLRRHEHLLEPPPPAAFGDDQEQVLGLLERQLLEISGGSAAPVERYLWTEEFEARRVEVDVHPQTAAGGATVIGLGDIPLRIGYAACQTAGGNWRVMAPRFGWTFVLQDLSLAAEVVRAAVYGAMLGEAPAWIYDFRRDGDESVLVWSPSSLGRLRGGSGDDADDDAPPALGAIAEEWVGKVARKRLPAPVGVDPIFDAHAGLLARDRPPSLLLVGPSGAGKTVFVRRLARRLLDLGRGKDARRRRLWATSADRIIAGMVYLGMWQERCLELTSELAATGDVLYVDRLVDIMQPQADGASIADLLAPAIVAGDFPVIAECDEEELVRCRYRNAGLLDAFRIVRIDELAPGHVLPLIALYQQRKAPDVELHVEAARRLVGLLGAFRRDIRFPGKAFTFLDWWNQQAEPRPATVLPRDVVAAYARWSGLPVALISDDVPVGAGDISGALRQGVIGQDHACDVAGRVLARFKAGIDDPERPVGTLFFVGPTGVGKTELAKQLAGYMFGSADRLVRLDMSEYATPGAAARLLEVGRGVSSLAERVRAQPLCVVLLDEIEKAHPEVFDLLLGVLGEGRLTDSLGRLVDLRMAVVVMTSNLGARDAKATGFGGGAATDYLAAVRAHFRPELYNRIDYVVSFRALAPADVERIVDLELAKIRQRPGLQQRKLGVRVTAGARALLAERGFDARMGARPLRRLIEEVVVTPLAVRMAADIAFRDRDVVVASAAEAATLGAAAGRDAIVL